MPQKTHHIIVSQQPDYFAEAQELMHGYFNFHQELEPAGAPWAKQPLVTRAERFTLSPEDMGAAFSDVAEYLTRVRHEAEPVLAGFPELAALYRVRPAQEDDGVPECFPRGALAYVAAPTAWQMTREDFARACLMQVLEWAGDLDEAGLEDQQALEALTDSAMNMGAIFDAVNRVPVSDDQRMALLRFFQELDAWYPRLRDLLAALEDICQAHYALVEQQFARKAKQLKDAGAEAEPLKWLARMSTAFADFRPEEPLYLNISVVGYNGLGVRLPMDRRATMRVQYGVLFQELDALQDKRRVRDELTERQLKAIADPTRLAIIRELSQGERYVQQLADTLGLTPATLSHHLNALLRNMLVGFRAEGRRSYYSLNRGELSELADDLRRMATAGGQQA